MPLNNNNHHNHNNRLEDPPQPASLSSDYLADAEAIVQNSPISPRQIIRSSSSAKNNKAQYSPKSPRMITRVPPPPPRTSSSSSSSYQRSSSYGSTNHQNGNFSSSPPRHTAASSSAAPPSPQRSPRPLPPPPLTYNEQHNNNSVSSFRSTGSSSSSSRRQQRQNIEVQLKDYQHQYHPSSPSYHNNNNNVDKIHVEEEKHEERVHHQHRHDEEHSSDRHDDESIEDQSIDDHSSTKTHDGDIHGTDNNGDLNQSHRSLDRSKAITTNTTAPNNDDDDDDDDNANNNKCTSIFKSLLCIFPKVEPLPWKTFTFLSLWCIIPPLCYILFFTQMGLGEHIYYAISDRFGDYAYSLALGLLASMLGLYMFDAECWSGKLALIFLDLCTMVIVLGVVLLTLCIADQFPYGMVCLFAIFQPLWLLAVKLIFYAGVDTRAYVSWLSGPLFLTSLCTGVAWMVWVFGYPENKWNLVLRMELAERSGCMPNFEEYPDCRLGGMDSTEEETCFSVENGVLEFPEGCDQSCTSVYNDCTNGFILWVGPVLVGMTMFFLSFFCTFLRTEGTKEKDIFNFGKVWLFILFAIWVTCSLSGLASGVTSALAALTLASFVASAVFIVVSFDRDARKDNTAAVFKRLQDKYGENLDFARGLFVATCAPIILIYFCFSITNQLIRKTRIFPCSHPVGDSNDMFTTRTRRQIDQMKTWDRVRVYTIAVYWGIFFIVMQVLVAKLTVVFLSWLIEQTASFGLGAVTALLVAVGITMFLLPPVPGVPVYLTLGIVLPAQGHETLGWIGSIGYSIAIGLLLKLFSSALQQKMIGENLSKYVRVRQFVGVNSTLMKAMRLVLSQDGLSIPKVAILIGGPDWPTSVLCGILRLSLPQIILGTIPIVLLILPTCVTGALLYMASLKDESGNPEFSWAGTVSTITASLTALVQFGSMIVAAYYLEQAADKRMDDVAAIEDDAEVKQADDEAAHLNKCYREVTEWEKIPVFPKLLIRSSLACIIIGCYIVQLFSSRCFTEHTLTDSIDDNLQGRVGNLFLPLGWVATGLFSTSIVLLYVFSSWGKAKARMKVKEPVPKPEALAYGSSDNTDFDLDLHAGADGIRADELAISISDKERVVEYRRSDSQGAQSTSTRF
eukprot:CAMPEP_0201726112 /NCGR_PEP_ID=MMETSP0593-20130828/9275_1 /ASSEMBLY_ACC=CAM_ASM_000672 /TAXON_ID=267983 /ORGANISM="Skeletonema japonicum, Strain CCMP2506" /LENGTH=1129 /DNA_ID=CAMNT_0048217581 /DNA_START=41 /DNA_END=3430 /DNA_ORIENTATION=+